MNNTSVSGIDRPRDGQVWNHLVRWGDQLLSNVAQREEGDREGQGYGRRVIPASQMKWVMDELSVSHLFLLKFGSSDNM